MVTLQEKIYAYFSRSTPRIEKMKSIQHKYMEPEYKELKV